MAEAPYDPSTDEVTLAIGGKLYGGWEDIRISRSLDTLSGQFELGIADRESSRAARIDLRAGQACEVRIAGETVITGWIDSIGPDKDSQNHALIVRGRDKSADLIDCSAIAKPGSWSNVTLESIAAQLASPFGITVTAKASTAPNIRKFAIQPGETVFAAIERLCRFRGLLAVSTIDGNVELIAAPTGAAVAQIVEGENATYVGAQHDVSGRYSDYIVKGQAAGDDNVNGKAASGPTATAKDPAITRYRPLVLIAEEQSDIASLEKRAKFEASTRAGRAQEARADLVGWRIGKGGRLWDRGQIARMTAPSAYIDGDMLVISAELVRGQGGTVTTLRLMPPEAYSQLAVPETAKASSVGGAA